MTTAQKRKEKSKKKRRITVSILIAAAIAIGGTFAWKTSEDSATNRFTSKGSSSYGIELTEPTWDATGELEAKETVAGKEIDKDPYVINDMETDVYIRLKIDFTYTDENGEEHPVSFSNNEDLTEFTYDSETCKVTSENKDKTYSRFLSTIHCQSSGSEMHLLSVDNEDSAASVVTSNNPYFYYDNGWFYYVDSDNTGTQTSLKCLAMKERTEAPLFTKVKLPVFDEEYGDLFANGFQINVTVEAVNVAKFVDADGKETISIAEETGLGNIKEIFDKADTLNSGETVTHYGSDTVKNKFTPAKVSVSVEETLTEDGTPVISQTGEQTLTWTTANGTPTAKKEVRIHCNDDPDATDCYARVCLLPKWESSIGTTTSFEVLDNENVEANEENGIAADKNDITFPDGITGNTFTIDGVTFTLTGNWSDNWIYKDGYFYYKKILSPGEDTELLLESVSIENADLNEHEKNGESLGVSVLTDAIQSDGGAVEAKWNATLSSTGELEKIGG